MSKRNFILLIIILGLAVAAVVGILYFRPSATIPAENTAGTDFFSQLNPFGGSSTTTPPATTPPADVSGYVPPPTQDTQKSQLVKVSSMPVAGFGLFIKERLKDVPIVAQVAAGTAPYIFGSAVLKNGSSGKGVMEIQRFLNNTLNLSLEQDGALDAEIVAAIKQWQGNHGLTADGIVGAKTKAVMYSSVNQNTQTSNPVSPPTEFVTAVRYAEKATGNIYQTFADKISERKFSGTIIPKIYDAYFGNKGESVIMRYLKADDKTIVTFIGALPKEPLGADTAGDNEIKATFLPENISDVSMSADFQKIFYLFNVGDNVVGTTLGLSDNKKAQVFNSPFTEWLPLWPNAKMITLTTKPSANVLGYMYAIDPANKNPVKILGGINGLTTLMSPNGKLVLYGSNDLSLYVYHTDTRNSDVVGVKTLPEKCVWGKTSSVIYCSVPKFIEGAAYPDAWYQGEISFSDQIWKIDIANGNTTLIIDPITVTGGEDIDGIKLALDESENYLFFVNKKDSYLWTFELK